MIKVREDKVFILMKRIEEQRKVMNQLAKIYGLNSGNVVEASQKLDRLITELQSLKVVAK